MPSAVEMVPPPPAVVGRQSAHAMECWVAGIVVAVGSVVLAGWVLGIRGLINLVPGTAYMVPNTALAFVITGCALFLLQVRGPWARRGVQLAALIVGLIALITLGEYASGLNFGIDEFLFHVTDPAMAKANPARMALSTSILFGLTAVALALLSRPPEIRRPPLILGSIGLLVVATSLFVAFSFVSFFILGYGSGDLAGMAVHTAALFFLMGWSILVVAWRAAEGRWMIRQKLTAGFAFALAMMIAFAAFSQQSTLQQAAAAASVAHTHEVIGVIHQIKGDYEEVAQGMRGFVITGNEAFLTITYRSMPRTFEGLTHLRQLMADNPERPAQLNALESAIVASFEHSQRLIAARRERGFEAAAQMVAGGQGAELSEQVRLLLGEMSASEERLLLSRHTASVTIRQRSWLILPSGVLVSVLILIFGILRLNVEAAANHGLNDLLRHHAEQLEAANKELESFSYSVSHDLRAPLRAIDGFSRMISEDYTDRLDDDGRRMLRVISDETLRMSHLIDDLLAFSRISRQQIALDPIDMQALAQGVFDELAASVPERHLRLELHSLPPAIGTPSLVRQVWINLLNNAVKFTRGRELGVIEIGTRGSEDGAPIYYVKDNGVGFDMRYIDQLFGVFHRLHTDESFEGTGIGLSLVKRIIQRHGGRIWAEAEVDHGATFYFTLTHPVNPTTTGEMLAEPKNPHE